MQLNYDTWVPRIGESIKRRGDPEAPRHYVTGVKGVGAYRTVSIDATQSRWWATDMFEPFDPYVPPAPVVEEPVAAPIPAAKAEAPVPPAPVDDLEIDPPVIAAVDEPTAI